MKKRLRRILLIGLTFALMIFILDSCIITFPGYITLTNASALVIINFYASPSSSGSWGSDRLGTSTLAPGNSAIFSVTSGYWDAFVRDSTAFEAYEYDFYIPNYGNTNLRYNGIDLDVVP